MKHLFRARPSRWIQRTSRVLLRKVWTHREPRIPIALLFTSINMKTAAAIFILKSWLLFCRQRLTEITYRLIGLLRIKVLMKKLQACSMISYAASLLKRQQLVESKDSQHLILEPLVSVKFRMIALDLLQLNKLKKERQTIFLAKWKNFTANKSWSLWHPNSYT